MIPSECLPPNQNDKPIVVSDPSTPDVVSIYEVDGFSENKKAFLIAGYKLMLRVIGSEEFHKRAVAMVGLTETNGKTLEQVYQGVIAGDSNCSSGEGRNLKVSDTLYMDKGSSTIGYTYGKLQEWINRFFFDEWETEFDGLGSLAGHLFHEYLHRCGYFHRYSHMGTLVYSWGYLVRDMGKDLLKSESHS